MVKLSKTRAGYLLISGCLFLLFGWLCFLLFVNKQLRVTASGYVPLTPAPSQFPV